MPSRSSKHRWSRSLTRPTAVTLAALVVIGGTWVILPESVVLPAIGILITVLLGLALAYARHWWLLCQEPTLMELPLLLAGDAPLLECYRTLGTALNEVRHNPDPLYHDLALEHLNKLAAQARTIAAGTFTFDGTEAWRIIYERLLRSPGLHLYRSVAWVKSPMYWQDEPGRKSMAVNFELNDAERINIERIAIIADHLWPEGDVWPVEQIRQWLAEQHQRGIWIKFVRQSALANEPDLITDIGLYGARALGIQELDDECRTTRFTLTFDFAGVAEAEERWKRLTVYAESFASYLDRYEMP